MSDDDDYGFGEDFDADEGNAGDEFEPEEGDEAERAASPEEQSEMETEGVEEGVEEVEEESEAEEELAATKPLAASRVRVDPILRMSNTHRRVIVVPDEERITSNVLKISEAARAIAIRAEQIEKFPVMFTEAQEGSAGLSANLRSDARAAGPREVDSVALAKAELLARRSPLIVRRVVGYGTDRRGAAGSADVYVEEWRVREMAIPPLD